MIDSLSKDFTPDKRGSGFLCIRSVLSIPKKKERSVPKHHVVCFVVFNAGEGTSQEYIIGLLVTNTKQDTKLIHTIRMVPEKGL